MKIGPHLASSLLLTITLYNSLYVSAQNSPSQNDTPSVREKSTNRILEEIIVTAQKRSEDMQSVPISITAYSAEALDARGAFDTKALADITPAMTITEFAGYAFIYIRGVGTDAFVPSEDPSVTTYIDGVYVPQSQGIVSDLGGVERVEILKGPQGTLFGRNSTGGAINVITKRPGSEFEASAQAQIGNYKERRFKGYLNLPITDSFGASADILFKQLDHQYTHESRELPQEESLAGRIRLNWRPTENLELDAMYFRAEQKSLGSLISKNIDPSPLGTIAGIPDGQDNYIATTDYETALDGYHEIMSMGLDWYQPWFDLSIDIADQTNLTYFTAYDFDGSASPLVGFTAHDQYGESQNIEVQLTSKPEGFLSDWGKWVLGSYYLESEGGYSVVNLYAGRDALLYAVNLLALPQALLENLNPLLGPLNDAGDIPLPLVGILSTESASIYGEFTFDINSWMDFTLGGRYQDEERTLEESSFSAGLAVIDTELPVFVYPQDTTITTNFSSRAVLTLYPREDWMVYLSRAEGFKSATYNIINVYSPQDAIRPELVTGYELGMKADFYNGALRINAALFDTKIKDKHVQVVSLVAGGVIRIDNAEMASIRGAEFDATILPFPDSNPGLVITLGGAYLDANYDKFTSGKGYDEGTGLYTEGLDFSGNDIERTPKFAASIGINQTLIINSDNEIELGVDANYNGEYFFSAQNNGNLTHDAYTLVNARIGYLYTPWNIRATLFGRNVMNERYYIGKYQNDFGILSNRAYQAQYGLRLGWQF
ncbi:TonB-dependent receptor [Zhongshania marina]|uniref:TonB-dependent receptor n=1 Tax=Zhongshania marina TaxID=2304603 RepID=A0ABX9W657_9GAMM|nr:hypothetical protein D0911_06855 [Zhongshania marina]